MTIAAGCVVVPLCLGRGGVGIRRLAVALLGTETAFSLVKLGVYHESASFVFFAIIATAAVLLGRSSR